MNILSIIGRDRALFSEDVARFETQLKQEVEQSSFLVLGGAGSIGMAVTRELFQRNPKRLHVVDISENNLAELVRDLRSSHGYIEGDFRTLSLDIGSAEYDAFVASQENYDYVLNFSALKHVRSEKDPYTLMRMVNVNILNTEKTLRQAIAMGSRKYFCVSTDKAANPVSMMGASKRIMEMFLDQYKEDISISTARFANVAFSDGSLLHSFNQRLAKGQPIVAPADIKRYFVTSREAGELCMMSCLLGENMDIFFPKLEAEVHLISLAEVAVNYLRERGYEPHLCESEEEARSSVEKLRAKGQWPCYFSGSDTSGEKPFEEFFTATEKVDLERFSEIGIVKDSFSSDPSALQSFKQQLEQLKGSGNWQKEDILALFKSLLPAFGHKETGKSLDDKM